MTNLAKSLPTYSMATAQSFVGHELGTSSWIIVDQTRIDQFATCTGDRQWTHVEAERAARETNPYVNPGRMTIGGHPIDMGKVDIDSYVVAGTIDHITPWQGCYETARLYGKRSTFVLSNSGHIQSLINPPDNRKAFFWAGAVDTGNAELPPLDAEPGRYVMET